MSIIKCKECGKEYSEFSSSCPECSCPTEFNLVGNNAKDHLDIETQQRESTKDVEKKSDKASVITGLVFWVLSAFSIMGNQSLTTTAATMRFIFIALLGLIYFTLVAKILDRFIISRIYKVDRSSRKGWISFILTLLVLTIGAGIFIGVFVLWAGDDWDKVIYMGQIAANLGFSMFLAACYIYRVIKHNKMTLFLGRIFQP